MRISIRGIDLNLPQAATTAVEGEHLVIYTSVRSGRREIMRIPLSHGAVMHIEGDLREAFRWMSDVIDDQPRLNYWENEDLKQLKKSLCRYNAKEGCWKNP